MMYVSWLPILLKSRRDKSLAEGQVSALILEYDG